MKLRAGFRKAKSVRRAGKRSLSRLDGLRKEVVARDRRIRELEDALAQKEAAFQAVAVSAAQFSHRLDRLRQVLRWSLFRRLQMGIRRLLARYPLGLVPFQQLQAAGASWQSEGTDPQFLLVADRAWHGLTGWAWLELECFAEHPLPAELFFDFGTGFQQEWRLQFSLTGGGSQRIPVFVPSGCRVIRLDPCSGVERFRMGRARLVRLKRAPSLTGEYLEKSAQYEALGGFNGNFGALLPCKGIVQDADEGFSWRAQDEDPVFLLAGFRPLQEGWCRIELEIDSNLSRGNGCLYLDCGDGFRELDTVKLPFRRGERVSIVFPLQCVPRHIRFDPFDCRARFSIRHLSLANVTPKEARRSMLERLISHHPKFRGNSLRQLAAEFEGDSCEDAGQGGSSLADCYVATLETFDLGYEDWIERNEAWNPSEIEEGARGFSCRPRISVVMPVYNTTEALLRKAIDSVVCQSYPDWELCIADDCSTVERVRELLEGYRKADERIKVVCRQTNGHISAASNSALGLATGDFVALLDHDDELAEHALHFVVEAINRNPQGKIFYSDEDKIDMAGVRSGPHFKSDWNPDLLYSQNYVSHLGVYRHDLLKRVGGFREGFEGSQDHDLLLRCLLHADANEIIHVTKVLYHWRKVEGSTALRSAEKDYALQAGIRALQDHFRDKGEVGVRVGQGLAPNTYRVLYPLPDPPPLVSLLIPTRDRLELLEPCVRSILEQTSYPQFEVVILDNDSREKDTVEFLSRIQSEDDRVRVCSYAKPFNFSAINNFGASQARGEVLGLVNNDIKVISPGWLDEMVRQVLRSEIGCVGSKLYYEDDTLQHAGVIVGLGGVAGHSHKGYSRENPGYQQRLRLVQNLSAVTAACLLVRKEVFGQVGGFDETLAVAFNDVDFCLKVREAGYRNLWTPYAELYHFESKSRGKEDTPERMKRFNGEVRYMRGKWGRLLRADPYYSPNLTLAREDFSLR